jgi:divalent metal cation (Fe/Co/Zn/Cd) transporter
MTKEMPYGFGKVEALGSCVCFAMVLGTGVGVGAHSAHLLFEAVASPAAANVMAASDLSLWCGAATACLGIIAKELLYRETLRVGKLARSSTMIANAAHHRFLIAREALFSSLSDDDDDDDDDECSLLLLDRTR